MKFMPLIEGPLKIEPGVFIENGTAMLHVLPEGYYFPKLHFEGTSREVQEEFTNRLLSLYRDAEYTHRVCSAWRAGNIDDTYTATRKAKS